MKGSFHGITSFNEFLEMSFSGPLIRKCNLPDGDAPLGQGQSTESDEFHLSLVLLEEEKSCTGKPYPGQGTYTICGGTEVFLRDSYTKRSKIVQKVEIALETRTFSCNIS
ncbi:MAG: hypothetical protein IJ083_04395, partial [Clostridia bacterium]|nr:hypothetical protein [Clostridia bacterium]